MADDNNTKFEKEAEEAEEKEKEVKYNQLLKKLEKGGLKSVDAYKNILQEDDEKSKQSATQATEEDIQKEVQLLLNPTKEWSTENEEVKLFREAMKKAKASSTSAEKPPSTKERTLPPSYVSTEPLPAEMDRKFFICKVTLINKNIVITRAIPCDSKATAAQFAATAVQKLLNTVTLDTAVEDWIFKATGTAEYCYGDVKMMDFEHVRRCFKGKDPIVPLTLMEKEAVLNETDQSVNELKNIEYDIGMKNTGNVVINHDNLKFDASSWDQMEYISLWDLQRPLKFKIHGVDNIILSDSILKLGDPYDMGFYICLEAFFAGKPLVPPKYTRFACYNRDPRFMQYVEFNDLMMASMPRETKICITLFGKPGVTRDEFNLTEAVPGKKDFPIGWYNFQPFDHKGMLKTGRFNMKMWPDHRAKPTGNCTEYNGEFTSVPLLQFEMESFNLPVVFPDIGAVPESFVKEQEDYESFLRKKYPKLDKGRLQADIEKIVKQDPLYILNEEEKWRLWDARDTLKKTPKALPKLLQSVNWKNPAAVRMMHQLLEEFDPMSPVDALELLDYNYADAKVRRWAIQKIDMMEDNELAEFLLQIIQGLKFELYHDCSLVRFLLQRSLRSTHLIGHIMFWHLKAEMHVTEIKERHGVLLEEYLRTCGGHRRELIKQNGVVDQILGIAMEIKKIKGKDLQNTYLRNEIVKCTFPPKFKLPLSPRLECKGIKAPKCKVMDSAKRPLWLVFVNADESGDDILVIFKAGDDLRQDLLTLQIIKIMDKWWKQKGLHLHMNPYNCVSTGDGVGMIEVVLNSATHAEIVHTKGGAKAVYKKEPLLEWLKEQNPSDKDFQQAQQNFCYSCAGYCVVTYVLGIGDRHNDNVMITKKGDLFHIDFGHFLGHFKKFAGMNRETSPFVFTQMYAHVLGGVDSALYKQFLSLACQAYNIVREYGHLMMTLFMLMLETGIEELESVEDVAWLQKTLKLDYTVQKANDHFTQLTKESLENQRQLLSDYIHIVAHYK